MSQRAPCVALLLVAAVMLGACVVALLRRPVHQDAALGTAGITYRIDPNHVNADTLCLLPRIGPGIARRIIDDRDTNGPFEDTADMTRVKMVGDKTAAAIEPWVEFD